MKVKLFTSDGDGFVTEAEIPPFNKAPDLVIWGQRFFVAPNVDADVRAAEVRAGEIAYVEAFTYAIP